MTFGFKSARPDLDPSSYRAFSCDLDPTQCLLMYMHSAVFESANLLCKSALYILLLRKWDNLASSDVNAMTQSICAVCLWTCNGISASWQRFFAQCFSTYKDTCFSGFRCA